MRSLESDLQQVSSIPDTSLSVANKVDFPWPELCKQCHNPAPFRGRLVFASFGVQSIVDCPDPFHFQIDISATPAKVVAEEVAGRERATSWDGVPCPPPRPVPVHTNLSLSDVMAGMSGRRDAGITDLAERRAYARRWLVCRARFVGATVGALIGLAVAALR